MDSSENSTTLLGMPSYPDRSSSLVLDSLMPTRLSPPVSGVDYLCPLSFANSHFSVPLSHSLTGVPSPLPVTSRSRVRNPFFWFRAKTDKGIVCLADHLHSVTNMYKMSVCMLYYFCTYATITQRKRHIVTISLLEQLH